MNALLIGLAEEVLSDLNGRLIVRSLGNAHPLPIFPMSTRPFWLLLMVRNELLGREESPKIVFQSTSNPSHRGGFSIGYSPQPTVPPDLQADFRRIEQETEKNSE